MNIFKEDDDRPAHTHSAKAAALAIVKQLVGKTKDATHLLGMALIDLKKQCGHGEWMPALKLAGINRMTAHRLMERSNVTDDGNLDLVDDDGKPFEDEGDASKTGTAVTSPPVTFDAPPGPAPTPPATPPKAAPFRWNVQCRPCRVAGKPHNPKCKACKAENAPPRDPGDDTKQTEADKNKPKPGAVVWDPKEFNGHIASQTRLIDRVARAGGLVDAEGAVKQTPEIAGFHRRLQELQNEVGRFARAILKKLNEQPKSPII